MKKARQSSPLRASSRGTPVLSFFFAVAAIVAQLSGEVMWDLTYALADVSGLAILDPVKPRFEPVDQALSHARGDSLEIDVRKSLKLADMIRS